MWEDVSDLLRDPERIQKEYQRRLTDDNNESCLALKQNEATIGKVKRAIARLIDAYEDDLISKQPRPMAVVAYFPRACMVTSG